VTSLERLGAELAGALLLVGCFVGWWQLHNRTEQHIGATQCVAATTITRKDAVRDDQGIEAAHAAQLTQVVAIYDQKLADSLHANDGLARRLHDYALRQGAVSCAGPAPGAAASAGALPGGAGRPQPKADPFGIDAATQAVIDAAAADNLLLEACRAAWAGR
jgi:hypothetical protein